MLNFVSLSYYHALIFIQRRKFIASSLLGSVFNSEDWGSTFLRNVGELDYTALHPSIQHFTITADITSTATICPS
jgi:hypothetical protein